MSQVIDRCVHAGQLDEQRLQPGTRTFACIRRSGFLRVDDGRQRPGQQFKHDAISQAPADRFRHVLQGAGAVSASPPSSTIRSPPSTLTASVS